MPKRKKQPRAPGKTRIGYSAVNVPTFAVRQVKELAAGLHENLRVTVAAAVMAFRLLDRNAQVDMILAARRRLLDDVPPPPAEPPTPQEPSERGIPGAS